MLRPPYEGLLSNQTSLVPVYYKGVGLPCQDVDIFVQSVRWPATRLATTSTTPPACTLKSTCNTVDATVWVIPRAEHDIFFLRQNALFLRKVKYHI